MMFRECVYINRPAMVDNETDISISNADIPPNNTGTPIRVLPNNTCKYLSLYLQEHRSDVGAWLDGVSGGFRENIHGSSVSPIVLPWDKCILRRLDK
jgi:hypothetical protein